jgi:hypothetical protein
MLCGWIVDQERWKRKKSFGWRVPSSQTSLYRLLRGEYHVHRPLFTGHPGGLVSQGKCQVFESPFTDSSL